MYSLGRGPLATVLTREIRQLREACAKSRQLIADKFLNNVVTPSSNSALRAWGQYLELRGRGIRPVSTQFGIYGTSAGVQVLSLMSPATYQQIIDAASGTLPLIAATVSDGSIYDYFQSKGDLCVVYKVAAIVDAYQPGKVDIDDIPASVVELLSLRRDGVGWPDFLKHGLEEFQDASAHATATALLSLTRFTKVRAGQAFREAVAWLENVDVNSLSIATLSLILLALHSAGGAETRTRGTDELMKKCRSVLVSWASRAVPEDVRRSIEALEYLLPKPSITTPLDESEQEFTFLLYMPHCLAAIALMAEGGDRHRYRVRRYLISVVREITQRMAQRGSFVVAGRNLVSAVESLWIFRLLARFEKYEPFSSYGGAMSDWLMRQVTPKRTAIVLPLAAGASLAAGIAGSWVSSLFGAVVISFVTGVAASIFVRDFFAGE
jgi:hypothetical protein